MNHVTGIDVWVSAGTVNVAVHHQRGEPKTREIVPDKAHHLAGLMFTFMLWGRVQIHPFLVFGCYGWSAERI